MILENASSHMETSSAQESWLIDRPEEVEDLVYYQLSQIWLIKLIGFVSYDNMQSSDAAVAKTNGLQVGAKRLMVQKKKGDDDDDMGGMLTGSNKYTPY